MITKTANLFLIKKAGWADDLVYNAKDLVGANSLDDKAAHAVRKGAEKVLGVFGGLKKNVDNAINGGHDGSLSDRASQLLSHLSAKAQDVKARARRAYRAASDAYNLDER